MISSDALILSVSQHTVIKLHKPIVALNQQKLNVINYKHETNALAYTFKSCNWQI